MAETWNETTPAGTDNPKQGDDRIRELKRAIRERLAADHHFESTEGTPFGDSGSEIGFHKKVILIEQASDPTTLENEIAIYIKNDGGSPAVFIRLESSGAIFQLTKGSKLLHNAVVLPEQGSAPATGANEVAHYSKDVSGVAEAFVRKESSGTELQLTSGNALVVETHADTHKNDGSDEIDGDKLEIDYIPEYYTPDPTPNEADSTEDLTAHLYGINAEIAKRPLPRYLASADNTYGLWSNSTQTRTLCTLSLPAYKMGINGIAHCETVGFAIKNNSGDVRNFAFALAVGGSSQLSVSLSIPVTTNYVECTFRAKIINNASQTANRVAIEIQLGNFVSGNGFAATKTIDTTTGQTITLTGTMAYADNDYEFRAYGGRLEMSNTN